MAARQRGVYWSRLGFALAAIVISAFFMMSTLGNRPTQISVPLFTSLSILAYLYCFLAGIFITSDCLCLLYTSDAADE